MYQKGEDVAVAKAMPKQEELTLYLLFLMAAPVACWCSSAFFVASNYFKKLPLFDSLMSKCT
jgi:hypothetical protein